MADRARLGPKPRDHQEQDETRPGPNPVDHGETEDGARPRPTPRDHGEEGGERKLNQDRVQWITGSTQAEKKEAEQGEGRWESRKGYAPPASKDAADGASLPLRQWSNT